MRRAGSARASLGRALNLGVLFQLNSTAYCGQSNDKLLLEKIGRVANTCHRILGNYNAKLSDSPIQTARRELRRARARARYDIYRCVARVRGKFMT
jgi:hypothetical protein